MDTVVRDEISSGVQESLNCTPYACSSLVKLSGGTANFVYRGTLINPLPDGSETIVLKHTEPYVASNKNFKLTTTRCDFEHKILTALQNIGPSLHDGITVKTPKVYSFDDVLHTQVYEDLPASLDLKTYVLKHSQNLTEAQSTKLGYSIGLWAQRFHSWVAAPEQKDMKETMKGNVAMMELKYQLNYGSNLMATIPNFPELLEDSKELFGKVGETAREYLDSDKGTLIHGDFWSGNVLIPETAVLSPESPMELFIIDWELAQISSLSMDLGQMIAELFELKHFKDIDAGIWLTEGFVEGYGVLEEEVAFKTAIHVGLHLVVWGSRVQGWGTKEQVEKVVEIGRDFVEKGYNKDKAWFDGSVLKCLFQI